VIRIKKTSDPKKQKKNTNMLQDAGVDDPCFKRNVDGVDARARESFGGGGFSW
jgi:hypothetical protein